MKKCPFFGKCGGCKYDFCAPDYAQQKLRTLKNASQMGDAIWTPPGLRRRADFCFRGGEFGFFAPRSKDIIQITNCPNLVPEINKILPAIAALPFSGAGSCLVTKCDNGIDITIESNITFYGTEFKNAAAALDVIRVTWNGNTVKQTTTPTISFAGRTVEYPSGGFLQPTEFSETAIRNMVIAETQGAKKVVDLFCGLGNFTFATQADGFDIVGAGVKRDLFKNPVTVGMLRQYDCVIMDPPRAGGAAQCTEIARSNIKKIIYISCNPETFLRDAEILTKAGFEIKKQIPVDQFVGSGHWELYSVLTRD